MSRFITSALIALATAAVFAPAALAQKPVVASISVSYADLDLSREAGVQTLLKRLNGATKSVCGKRPMSVRFGNLGAYFACRDAAISGAVRRVGNANLSTAYAMSIGAQPVKLAQR